MVSHLHLMLKLRMCGFVIPRLLFARMAWCICTWATVSVRIKLPELEAGYSVLSSIEIKNM
jgi:hypothetical protein